MSRPRREPAPTPDDRLFLPVNAWARQTPLLHAPVLASARHGVVVFGALLLAALAVARHGSSHDLAATGWAAVATLLAVVLNQPIVAVTASGTS